MMIVGATLLWRIRGIFRRAKKWYQETLILFQAVNVTLLYQKGGRTQFDRYPHLFSALRDQLDDHPTPRVVSFGCSVGDETLSLRAYLPTARIFGTDVNRTRIRIARKRVADPKIRFHACASLAALGEGEVDAIVCLSVMHRSALLHEWPTDCRPHMTFQTFEKAIRDFDQHLKVGGFLLLYHTSFEFLETDCARRYTPLYLVEPLSHSPSKRYDRNNQPVLVPMEQRYALYRKDSSSV
jgi:hypothetical protein